MRNFDLSNIEFTDIESEVPGHVKIFRDMLERAEYNQNLDKNRQPTNDAELFDAFDRAYKDRKDLIREMHELRMALEEERHERITTKKGPIKWESRWCFTNTNECFCAYHYYYGSG